MTPDEIRVPGSPQRAVFAGGIGVVVCTLPAFLVGALSTEMSSEFAFSATQLGLTIVVFKATGVASSHLLGGVADRLGATVSLRVSIIGAGIACLGIATTIQTSTGLVAWLMVAALAKALSQPAANRLLSRRVPVHHQGFAFGVKQSAAPAASMIAGLSVPIVALTAGWRVAFVATAGLGLIALTAVGRRSGPRGRSSVAASQTSVPSGDRTVAILAVAFGLSSVASATVPIFFVPAALEKGHNALTAGSVLAGASLAAIAARVILGIISDRITRGHLWICTVLLGIGGFGLGLLARGSDSLLLLGAVIAMAGTWGLNGVFWYSLVRLRPNTPGKITGAVAPAGMVGGMVGPGVMGFLSDSYSFDAGWWFLCGAAWAAAVAMAIAASSLARFRGKAP